MHSVEHTLKLKDGRLLAYHTFPNAEEEEEEEEKVKVKADKDNIHKEGAISITTAEQEQERHPVLYFHGYPSCGLEGGVTSARSIARAGGRLYAIDRPGMGKISSPYYPYNNNKDEDKEEEKENNNYNYNNPNSNSNTNLDTFVENVWELVEDQGWKDFSILGLSGGGPYILAVLASYLQRMEKQKYKQKQQQQHQSSEDNSNSNTKSLQALPRLRNVCLVCAVCMSTGSDGMKSGLESMNTLVESASTSRISRFWLHTFALTQGIVNSYIIPILPISWIQKGMIANVHTPITDQQWIVSNEGGFIFSNYILARTSMAAQGQLLSNPGIYDDTLIVVRAHHSHEDIIRKHYNNDDDGDTSANNTNTITNSSSSSSNNTNKDDNDLEQDDDDDDDLLPAVGIFQGTLDMNVPLSHAQFMHQSIFNEHKRSKLILYEDLGHLSTIFTKSGDYAAFATRTRTRTMTLNCTNK